MKYLYKTCKKIKKKWHHSFTNSYTSHQQEKFKLAVPVLISDILRYNSIVAGVSFAVQAYYLQVGRLTRH